MTRLFLDGGDPAETRQILNALDGQTTNPTLISKNPEAQGRLARGEKFQPQEIYDFYRRVVTELSGLLPNGSISIEVYADATTTTDQMITQALQMWEWIPNAHIKLPTTAAGLAAAQQAVSEGMRVNMTLCFSQEQAAAVYAATKGAKKGDVFVSPFIGRLDDIGQNGVDLIKHILKMYEQGDGHVEVLSASIRSREHLQAVVQLGSDIVTAPLKIIQAWLDAGRQVDPGFAYQPDLSPIPYREVSLEKEWDQYDVAHELTTKGIDRFAADWNSLITQP
ncbi:transaldolase [Patescibacteria group bacterium]|nr:transaldolase [Patescibacteria group bacterium]